MLVLLDNNFVDRDGLREYLETSPDHRAAIPHTAFVEWHKGAAEKVTRMVLQQACRFAPRIMILRDTQSLLRMRGEPKRIMTRLIDEQQTRYFPTYCTDHIEAQISEELSAQFALHGEQARKEVAELQGEARKLMASFAKWDECFSFTELQELKGVLGRGEKLSEELQIKTYAIAEFLATRLLDHHGLAHLARDRRKFVNTLAFRYGAMTIGLYIRMRDNPGPYPVSDKKTLAHLMDIKIAAQGTYFDDFLTNEPGLKQAYEVAMSLIRALGGFTRCGR